MNKKTSTNFTFKFEHLEKNQENISKTWAFNLQIKPKSTCESKKHMKRISLLDSIHIRILIWWIRRLIRDNRNSREKSRMVMDKKRGNQCRFMENERSNWICASDIDERRNNWFMLDLQIWVWCREHDKHVRVGEIIDLKKKKNIFENYR